MTRGGGEHPLQTSAPSSYGLGKTEFWKFGGNGSLTDWLTHWMNCKGVCRTAPATLHSEIVTNLASNFGSNEILIKANFNRLNRKLATQNLACQGTEDSNKTWFRTALGPLITWHIFNVLFLSEAIFLSVFLQYFFLTFLKWLKF